MIKVISDVNKNDSSKTFGISRMEDIYEKRRGVPNEPHRHSFFTVVYVLKSKGKHVIDFNDYEMNERQVFFIHPGQVHSILEEQKSFGYSIVFDDNFLVENHIPKSFIDELKLFNHYEDSSPLILNEKQNEELSEICEEMINYYTSDKKLKEQAIGALLKLFFIGCNNICNLDMTDHVYESGRMILKSFKDMVEEKFKEYHNTSEYATRLSITPDHLNRSVKSLTGKTAKEYIQSRIIMEAKRMLQFTTSTNKEIGYELGFSEPGNFSAFYKKCTGKTPTEFRKNI